ncbi:MAG: hypothetical protein ACLR23_00960 [Clostridia bacterium]
MYAISCAASFFGFDPIQILGAADIGNSGVDEQAAMILTYEDGQMAVLNSGVNVSMPGWMEIYGRDGYLEIPSFWDAQVVRLHRNGKDEVETFSFPHRNGFVYEVEHASRCIREGLMESPIWPFRLPLRWRRLWIRFAGRGVCGTQERNDAGKKN